jgi:ABC-type Na+ efflux pump permease subunit
MKKNWRVVMIALVVPLVIFAALNIASGNGPSAGAQEKPIVGRYAETSNTDPEAVAAARFAIKTQGRKKHARISLVAITRAEAQVVAGFNYRLCVRVKIKGKTRDVTVVVYKTLKQKYSLISWVAGGCKER